MTRFWPPGETTRRPPAPRVAASREPVDPARIGRRVVRRRAKGMDGGAVAAAPEDARFDARQASRHEDLADDARGPAELAEWERIDQLLAEAAPGTVYDPDTDDVVQASSPPTPRPRPLRGELISPDRPVPTGVTLTDSDCHAPSRCQILRVTPPQICPYLSVSRGRRGLQGPFSGVERDTQD